MTQNLKSIFVFSGLVLFAAPFAEAQTKWPKPAVVQLRERLKSGVCGKADLKKWPTVCAAYGMSAGQKLVGFKVSQPNDATVMLESKTHVVKITRGARTADFAVNSVALKADETKDQSELRARIEKALARKTAKRYSIWLTVAEAAEADPSTAAAIQLLINDANVNDYCETAMEFGGKCVKVLQRVLAEVESQKCSNSEDFVKSFAAMRERIQDGVIRPLRQSYYYRACAFAKVLKNGDSTGATADALEEDADKKMTACRKLGEKLETAMTEPPEDCKVLLAEVRSGLVEVAGPVFANTNFEASSVGTAAASEGGRDGN